MPLADYSDMEQEILEAPKPRILPRGTEVKARIINVREGISEKNGCQWYSPVFDVPSDSLVIEFSGFLWDPAEKDNLDARAASRVLPDFREFAACVGLDYSRPFSWEDDLVGLEGWVILGVRKSDEYGDQNTVSRYVAGK